VAPGADGSGGAREAAQRMRDRAKRLRDHTPALRVVGETIRKLTDDGFQNSRELDGEAFKALQPSTIASRLRGNKGANKRTRAGVLTKGATKKREALLAPGGMKILQITAVQRNSQRATTTGKNKLAWSAVGRLLPHMTGSEDNKHPPKRNPTVFDVGRDGKPKLKPRVAKILHDAITSYVETGKVAS
jgi:hypothetical protein